MKLLSLFRSTIGMSKEFRSFLSNSSNFQTVRLIFKHVPIFLFMLNKMNLSDGKRSCFWTAIPIYPEFVLIYKWCHVHKLCSSCRISRHLAPTCPLQNIFITVNIRVILHTDLIGNSHIIETYSIFSGKNKSYEETPISLSEKIPISTIYYSLMRKYHKCQDSPTISLPLLTNFSSLSWHGVKESKNRNKVKEFSTLLRANSLSISRITSLGVKG
eukprot:TRINITY_DN2813_c0_g1_i4.p1 TRINITY_DN2813_c0_g1~~TRINITY_DN2813_c0_g1_i4.p1  ORF type:complete len:215 (+),score=-3.44 TRINITY_DN2813_c0_g1_i4:185-829(+)